MYVWPVGLLGCRLITATGTRGSLGLLQLEWNYSTADSSSSTNSSSSDGSSSLCGGFISGGWRVAAERGSPR